MAAKLTLDDIVDLRAYEREREEFRNHIIDLKRKRRIAVGPVVTIVFENRDTIRFQIQEMARAERMLTDEQIKTELDIYNPLVPEPNQLAATLFIELTSRAEMEEWLPKLVGVERAVQLRVGEGDAAEVVPCIPEPSHEAQLTRDEVTASVHYVWFRLTDDQVARVAAGPLTLVVDLPAYRHDVVLADATRASLLDDLRS